MTVERICFEAAAFQAPQPTFDESKHRGHREALVEGRIAFEIGPSELKQGSCGTEPILLQMNEGPGELNQPFVKRAIELPPFGQPEFLEHIMRFIKQAAIKKIEKA